MSHQRQNRYAAEMIAGRNMHGTAVNAVPRYESAADPFEAQPTSLADLAARVRQNTQLIEERYSAAGQVALDTNDLVTRLAEQFREVAEDVTQLTDILMRISKLSCEKADFIVKENAGLEALRASFSRVRAPISRLETVIRTVQMIGLTARVSAGSMNALESVRFVEDVRAIAGEATGLIKELSADLKQLAEKIDSASKARARFPEAYSARLKSLSENGEDNARRVEALADLCRGISRRAATVSDQTNRAYNDLAVALFAGDSVSQRLNHVAITLDRAVSLGGVQTLPHTVALQADQTDGATLELKSSLTALHQNREKLATTVRDFIEVLHTLTSSEIGNPASIREIKAQLSNNLAALVSSQAQRRGLDMEFGRIIRAIAAMHLRVKEVEPLERRLQVVSLNLSVTCMRATGDQRALATIAAQVLALAADTRTIVAEVLSALSDSEEAARVFKNLTDRDSIGEISKLARHVSKPLDKLEELNMAGELEAKMPKILDDLQGSPGWVQVLHDVQRELAAVAAQVRSLPRPDRLQSDPAPPDQDALAACSRAYTMQEERDIHSSYVRDGLSPDMAVDEAPGTSHDLPPMEFF